MKAADLNEAADPQEIPAVLRRAADYASESAGELDAAWQDRGAGNPWRMIAHELERAADRIAARL